jgi:hypothetical protein
MTEERAKRVGKVLGSIAIAMLLSMFGFMIFLSAERPTVPVPDIGYMLYFKGAGEPVFISRTDQAIFNILFYGPFVMAAGAAYVGQIGNRKR